MEGKEKKDIRAALPKEIEDIVSIIAEKKGLLNASIRNLALVYGLYFVAITDMIPREETFRIMIRELHEYVKMKYGEKS